MPNTATIQSNLDAVMDNEVTLLLQTLGLMDTVPGAVKAHTAVAQYCGEKHLMSRAERTLMLSRAENALSDAIPATTSPRDAANLAEALIRLGRIRAFQQIGFAFA